jgi:hypothetical protein
MRQIFSQNMCKVANYLLHNVHIFTYHNIRLYLQYLQYRNASHQYHYKICTESYIICIYCSIWYTNNKVCNQHSELSPIYLMQYYLITNIYHENPHHYLLFMLYNIYLYIMTTFSQNYMSQL